ncbi:MAG: hypothetical protein WCA46_30235 [Actinocatenispora sp.]
MSAPRRRSPASRPRRGPVLAGLVGLALLTGVTGCADTTYQLTGRASVINQLTADMDHNELVTPYTATYRLGDGSTASVTYAVHPRRVAYVFDSGRWARTNVAVMTCTRSGGTNFCSVRSVPPTPARPQPDLAGIRTASDNRFVPVEQVVSLLTSAAEDRTSSAHRSERRIAGRRATCVRVGAGHRTEPFAACFTAVGALASFTGRVDGHDFDVTMTGYEPHSVGRPFDPPRRAHVDYQPASHD